MRLSINLSGRSTSVFQNGFLPLRDVGAPNITLLDVDGQLAASFTLIIPDAAVTIVRDATVSSEKTIVAAVGAKSQSGQLASLLVFTDLNGTPKRIVQTNPFVATQVRFLPDGSLLCVGREHDEQFDDVPGHSVLRFYSAAGVLQGKALNEMCYGPTERDTHPLDWQLTLANDRAALLDKTTLRYVEFNHTGTIVRTLGPLGIDSSMSTLGGLAILANGDRLIAVYKTDEVARRFSLCQLKDDRDHVSVRTVTEIQPPRGSKGLLVAGVYKDSVVLLTTPAGGMLVAPQTLV